jgi:dTDP-4-dehydrorhamnose reductase
MYGHSKLAGEQAIRETACRHLIFRTSWVYAARGNNFAKTMLRLAWERDSLRVINDQIGAPTGADLIADITAHAIRQVLHLHQQTDPTTTCTNRAAKTNANNSDLSGTYHLAAGGETSWFSYARHVLTCAQQLGVKLKAQPQAIEPVPTSAFPTPARRPGNSRLNTHKLQRTFHLHLPPWQDGVQRMLHETLKD